MSSSHNNEKDGLDEIEALEAKAGDNMLETDGFMKVHWRDTESRIKRRVLKHLLYFGFKRNTAPVVITTFTPLLEALWNLLNELTADYHVPGKQTVKQWREHADEDGGGGRSGIGMDINEMREKTGKI